MVGSRHLRGTVLSRVRNLLRSGGIKKPPLWFPVVEAFPPLKETKLTRKSDEELMHKILYPEDEFRRLFYKRFNTSQPLSLWGEHHSYCDRFVEGCMEKVNMGYDKEKAVESIVRELFTGQSTAIPDTVSED
ncbi:hypothetical protein pdam_00008141 [Pocillopora damicornis]|uniref:Small ribosomal subunit protein mS23 n=1 Tax=Pocillopora damicornis TaxID=46731 RepID=A0A3M6UDX1_POCDA|nr:28S ribosomal protein S23, mitochondrial-like [Pocillopora damicornis]RMX51704.1 hypothetical protein pdam_00008141 [Pocillopora damicornis]